MENKVVINGSVESVHTNIEDLKVYVIAEDQGTEFVPVIDADYVTEVENRYFTSEDLGNDNSDD